MKFKVGDRVLKISDGKEGFVTAGEGNLHAVNFGDQTEWLYATDLLPAFSQFELTLPDPAPVDEEQAEKDRLREFFFGKKVDRYQYAPDWKKEGRCPSCGELGRVHLSTFVCSKHGVY